MEGRLGDRQEVIVVSSEIKVVFWLVGSRRAVGRTSYTNLNSSLEPTFLVVHDKETKPESEIQLYTLRRKALSRTLHTHGPGWVNGSNRVRVCDLRLLGHQ